MKYKLLLMPGVAMIDELTATKVRDFVKNGGTVIMTGYSGSVDKHSQVFTSTHPGLLSDVFGVRVAAYEETANLNELSRDKLQGNKLNITYRDRHLSTESSRIDVIQSQGASVIGHITSLDKDYPIVTSNKYGKGTAIYIGIPAKDVLLNPLIDDVLKNIPVYKGPETPNDVMARFIDRKHILYINLSKEDKEIIINGSVKSILSGNNYTGKFILKASEPEFIELDK